MIDVNKASNRSGYQSSRKRKRKIKINLFDCVENEKEKQQETYFLRGNKLIMSHFGGLFLAASKTMFYGLFGN